MSKTDSDCNYQIEELRLSIVVAVAVLIGSTDSASVHIPATLVEFDLDSINCKEDRVLFIFIIRMK